MSRVTLQPAYGRDYKSKRAIEVALEDGKDFILNQYGSPWDGKYVSAGQLVDEGHDEVNVRYNGDRKVAVIKLSGLRCTFCDEGNPPVSRDGRHFKNCPNGSCK
jgi:hypothetical protein